SLCMRTPEKTPGFWDFKDSTSRIAVTPRPELRCRAVLKSNHRLRRGSRSLKRGENAKVIKGDGEKAHVFPFQYFAGEISPAGAVVRDGSGSHESGRTDPPQSPHGQSVLSPISRPDRRGL